MRTTFSLSEVISELKEYCIAVCKDSSGFYTPRKFAYSTLPFHYLGVNYPVLTCLEACQIVDVLRGIYEDDNTVYSGDDELPFE